MKRFENIGIIGLGLIGGSIAKALDGKARLFIDDEVWQHLTDLDAVILAVPISAILEIGAKLASKRELLCRPLVVIDVGSVKESIAAQFEKWTQGLLEFVPTHPMAGKEQSGFSHSDKNLFQQACWVITPHAKNTSEALEQTETLICDLEALPLSMDAALHDKRAALISHLPYLLSKALLEFVQKTDPECLAMTGPGFRSMTRLAQEDPKFREELARYNQTNIDFYFNRFKDSL